MDYSKGVAQVFEEAARHVLISDQNVRLLCYVEATALAHLPSWAPDWNSQTLFPMDKIPFFFYRGSQFERGGLVRARRGSKTQDTCLFSDNKKQLLLTGCVLDTIDSCGQTWPGSVSDENTAILEDWKAIFAGNSKQFSPEAQYPYPTTPAGTLWRFWEDLLVSRRLKTTDTIRPFQTDHVLHEIWFKSHYSAHGSRFMPSFLRHYLPLLDWLTTSLPYASVGRKAVTTLTGFLALVPAQARTGDFVCFFKGGKSMPFVLRQQAADDFTLVGACYVHGFLVTPEHWLSARYNKMFRIL